MFQGRNWWNGIGEKDMNVIVEILLKSKQKTLQMARKKLLNMYAIYVELVFSVPRALIDELKKKVRLILVPTVQGNAQK